MDALMCEDYYYYAVYWTKDQSAATSLLNCLSRQQSHKEIPKLKRGRYTAYVCASLIPKIQIFGLQDTRKISSLTKFAAECI